MLNRSIIVIATISASQQFLNKARQVLFLIQVYFRIQLAYGGFHFKVAETLAVTLKDQGINFSITQSHYLERFISPAFVVLRVWPRLQICRSLIWQRSAIEPELGLKIMPDVMRNDASNLLVLSMSGMLSNG